jgi:hypothetical protein
MRIQMAMTVANNNTKANSGNVNSYASVVFNGIADIEAACAADDEMNVDSAFNFWANAVSGEQDHESRKVSSRMSATMS